MRPWSRALSNLVCVRYIIQEKRSPSPLHTVRRRVILQAHAHSAIRHRQAPPVPVPLPAQKAKRCQIPKPHANPLFLQHKRGGGRKRCSKERFGLIYEEKIKKTERAIPAKRYRPDPVLVGIHLSPAASFASFCFWLLRAGRREGNVGDVRAREGDVEGRARREAP